MNKNDICFYTFLEMDDCCNWKNNDRELFVYYVKSAERFSNKIFERRGSIDIDEILLFLMYKYRDEVDSVTFFKRGCDRITFGLNETEIETFIAGETDTIQLMVRREKTPNV